LTLVLAFTSMPRSTGKKTDASVGFRIMLDGNPVPNLIVNSLVAAVMMTTLVVGPFYLGLGLGLNDTLIGLVMSMGPAIAIFSGVPAGRAVDAWGARPVLGIGLVLLAAGALLLAALPEMVGVGGYVLAIVVLTPGYQLFQAANNTAALSDVPADRRGLVSGLLNLSRNIGLIVGASAMGAVFAVGVGTSDLADASALAIAGGMRLTFVLAGGMMGLAILVAFWAPLANALRGAECKE
jgi:MFS family permease